MQFCELYGSEAFIPKMHFLIHYPSQLLRFGLLIHSWTIRYEAKLRVIKSCSYKQFQKCVPDSDKAASASAMLLLAQKLLSSEVELGPSKCPSLLEECTEVLAYLHPLQHTSLFSHPSFVKYNGVTFK